MASSWVMEDRHDNEIMSQTSSVAGMASASAFFDYYELRRSRSNSPDMRPGVLDYSNLDMEDCSYSLSLQIGDDNGEKPVNIHTLLLNNNLLKSLPPVMGFFENLVTLNLSCNRLKALDSADLCKLVNLRSLIVSDNLLDDMSLPKDLAEHLTQLEVVNFSGNLLTQFPYQLLSMYSLREIYLGSNKIGMLPKNYENLQRLEILYLGGNQLRSVPEELCQLRSLTSLNLSYNQITNLPNCITKLKKLKNLALHSNNLTTLPVELVKLNLHELSLRSNPLVKRFAREYTYNVPSLLELCGRTIKIKNVNYKAYQLPAHLSAYLNSAQCCLNPKCKGVYFTSKVEHVKFVDFCGKFRVPLMQYLCSSTCNEKVANKATLLSSSSESSSESDEETENNLLKKILIG